MSRKVVRPTELVFVRLLRTPFSDVRTRFERIVEAIFSQPKEAPILIGLFLVPDHIPPRNEPPIADAPVAGDHGHWLAEHEMENHAMWLSPLFRGMTLKEASQYVFEKLQESQGVHSAAPAVFLHLISALPGLIPYRGTDIPLVPQHRLSVEDVRIIISDYPEMSRKVFLYVHEHWNNTEEIAQIFGDIARQFPDDASRLSFFLFACDNMLRAFAKSKSIDISVGTEEHADDTTTAIEPGKKPN